MRFRSLSHLPYFWETSRRRYRERRAPSSAAQDAGWIGRTSEDPVSELLPHLEGYSASGSYRTGTGATACPSRRPTSNENAYRSSSPMRRSEITIAAPARLALQLPLPLPALKDEGLVRLDDPRKPVRRLAHRRQEAVAPAMRRARRNPAALGRPLDRLACAKRGAKGKPTLLVVQPGQCRARQRTKCLPAVVSHVI